MNKEDIIQMARKAGLIEMDHDCIEGVPLTKLPELIALVAAAEREACAKVCEELETCSDAEFYGHEFAAAIRARGQA